MKICKYCGEQFESGYGRNRAMYCSDECRDTALKIQRRQCIERYILKHYQEVADQQEVKEN